MTTTSPAPEAGSTNVPASEAVKERSENRGADTPRSPGVSALRDRLSERFRTTKALPLLVLPLGGLFLFLASQPLWHTDLWGHLAYGRLIWETKSIPVTEPFMPLAAGVELVDTAWLSQVVGFLTIRQFGLPGLQFLAAACVTATAGVLAWLGYRKTGSVGWTLLGLAAFVWLNWKQLFNGAGLSNLSDVSVLIRPQMAGMVAFAVTLAVCVSRPSRWHWFVVPLTFAAWANLHGSFLAGLALLATFALGRGGDVLRRTDKFAAVFRDWPFWRLVLLTELAAVAVLLNPYGLRLYPEVWLFAKNPNLQDLVEWEPLTLRMAQGQAAAGVAFALLFLYRMTPRRITTGEALALLLFGGLTLWTSRMIVWWAPIAAYCLTVHAAAVWRARRTAEAKRGVAGAEANADAPDRSRGLSEAWPRITGRGEGASGGGGDRSVVPPSPPPPVSPSPSGDDPGYSASAIHQPAVPARRSLWTVTAIGLAWVFFALTPFAEALLRGPQEEYDRAVSSQTPVGAAQHLAEQPAVGQVFNTYELGDYLLWTNPGLPVFVAGHAHLVPTDVWRAYVETIRGGSGWEATLDRYGVNTVVLDRPGRQSFIDRLAEEPNWVRSYEDRNSAVFRRREPLR